MSQRFGYTGQGRSSLNMSKIRINELARELEVKPHIILELLPELGVAEKKTHSSSIDEDVALQVRRQLGGEEAGERTSEHEPEGSIAVAEAPEEHEADIETAHPAEAEQDNQPAAQETEEASADAAPAPPTSITLPPAGPGRAKPIRPPLASSGSSGTSSPAAPQQRAPSIPIPPRPAATIPTRPVPSGPRPGQILSGPRAPLPGSRTEPPRPPSGAEPPAHIPSSAAPGPPSAIIAPGVPRQAPSMPSPPRSAPVRPSTPGNAPGGAVRPPARPNLAGQPVARPVVPPRPDLVARLTQSQPKASPGHPTAQPRPGMPSRPSSPVPGQPIYRGPIRPGQPVMRGPGMPAAPGRGLRQRPMHPTSPLRAEPATLPTEQQRRRQTRGNVTVRDREFEEGKLRPLGPRREHAAPPPPIDREITVSEGITVKELSEKLNVKANLVIKKLVEKKVFATINQALDAKLAGEIAREFGASTNKVSYEQESIQDFESAEVEADRVKRAPVVTIMGHVDHGKTSLLDAIRSTDVAGGEAGGITQHIGAYQIVKDGRKVVFIDTPGHEAFTRMRARGAKVTDIVVLVVAADDGVMPQTLEAIDHARAARVPIIVAINKIDKPDAQPERIKQQLADRGLLAEDWGGDVVMVPVSAKAKTNLDLLLEMILLVADLQDLKANPDRPAVGTVLEAQLDRGRGPVATVLVRNGTLHTGDYFICGSVFSKVRAMFDDRGNSVKDAEPSMPVEVLGLDSLPEVGDTFQVVTDTAKAKQIVLYRESKAREAAMSKSSRMTLDKLHEQLREGEVKELNVILKTDVGGTAEVLTDTLQKLSNDKVRIRVLHSGVGAINETDVLLASASDAIIIGFNVRPERNAVALAEHEKVDIRLHTIIYELVDEIKRAMTGLLEPVFREAYKGRAEVREVFRISKIGTVAGCMVLDGVITRDSQIRLLRDNIVIFTGRIESLKRFKNDASEVKSGFECGIAIANYNDLKLGDVIEAFVTERVAPEAVA
jgi:translation initiation factor IF-2